MPTCASVIGVPEQRLEQAAAEIRVHNIRTRQAADIAKIAEVFALPKVWEREPVFLPPALYDAAVAKGFDMTGFAKTQVIPFRRMRGF